MNRNINKKISIILMISACALLFYSLLAKEYDFVYYKIYLDVPTSYYNVYIIGVELPYLGVLFVSIVSLSLGIYWYIQKEDEEIKLDFQKIMKRLGNIIHKAKIRLNNIITTLRDKKMTKKGIIISIGIVAFIALLVFLFIYYQTLNNSKFPLTIVQSIFMGFLDVAWKVLAVTLIITFIRAIFRKEK
jgi:hypothetical protein